MIVELEIFSGRPNPLWRLTRSQAAELARLIGSLVPALEGPAPEPPGLGYRGFQLRGPARSRYSAYRGFVVSPGGLLTDPNRRVERFLLSCLPADFVDLRRSLERELG